MTVEMVRYHGSPRIVLHGGCEYNMRRIIRRWGHLLRELNPYRIPDHVFRSLVQVNKNNELCIIMSNVCMQIVKYCEMENNAD